MNIPFRRIQTLVCLAEAGSFSRAAQALNLSQPAVSAQIRELEEQLGVALVHRTTRHVALTKEGEAFAARAMRALTELELATQDLKEASDTHRGQVVVACIPPLMATAIPEVVLKVDRRYPEVDVKLIDGRSNQVEPRVICGETDFGVGPEPASRELVFEQLYNDPFVAAVAHDHELAGRDAVSLSDLVDYPFIANSWDTNARQIVDRALVRTGKSLKPRFELLRYFSVGRFVEAGLGVTILPQLAFSALGAKGVVALPIRSPGVQRDIGIVTRREYRPSPAANAFMGVLREVMAEFPKTNETAA